MNSVLSKLQTLRPSARDVKQATNFPDWMVEDYLTMFENLVMLATSDDEVIIIINLILDRLDVIERDILLINEKIRLIDDKILLIEGEIVNLRNRIKDVEDDLLAHEKNKSAHGATGDIVGNKDYASVAVGGVVNLSRSVNPAIISSLGVISPDSINAPDTYTKEQMQSVVNLVNENKEVTNNLVIALNSCITQLNDMIAANKSAKQMESS